MAKAKLNCIRKEKLETYIEFGGLNDAQNDSIAKMVEEGINLLR